MEQKEQSWTQLGEEGNRSGARKHPLSPLVLCSTVVEEPPVKSSSRIETRKRTQSTEKGWIGFVQIHHEGDGTEKTQVDDRTAFIIESSTHYRYIHVTFILNPSNATNPVDVRSDSRKHVRIRISAMIRPRSHPRQTPVHSQRTSDVPQTDSLPSVQERANVPLPHLILGIPHEPEAEIVLCDPGLHVLEVDGKRAVLSERTPARHHCRHLFFGEVLGQIHVEEDERNWPNELGEADGGGQPEDGYVVFERGAVELGVRIGGVDVVRLLGRLERRSPDPNYSFANSAIEKTL